MTQHIEILDQERPLDLVLGSIKNSKIDIAVAFASKAEGLIETLLKNGNSVSLLIGTINNFTDPVFLRYCQYMVKIKSARLNVFVDFRGNRSIHWKLYLFDIDKIIIGSANMTSTGISMVRDTAIILQDAQLRQEYLNRILKIKRDYQEEILHINHRNFEQKLTEYEISHRDTFSAMLQHTSSAKSQEVISSNFLNWVQNEDSQIIPLFIWGRQVTEEEEKYFNQHVAPNVTQDQAHLIKLYIIGAYEGTSKRQEYRSGEIVLTLNSSGHHIGFHLIDFIMYANGMWWLCGVSKKSFKEPFLLTTELKKLIRQKRYEWIEKDKKFLNSKDLSDLALSIEKL